MHFFVNIFAYIGNFLYLCGKFSSSMWHLIWIVFKWLLCLAGIAIPYYLLIRTAILGHGFFCPDMRRIDAHYGLCNSWHSIAGYFGYYLLFLLLVVLPLSAVVVCCLM